MSEQALEVVTRALEAFDSGDRERILALTHRDFEAVVSAEVSAEPDTYRGHDGIRRYLDSFDDAMEDIRFEGERYWEVGDSVVVVLRLTARGRRTAIAVEQRSAGVWTVREGKVRSIHSYASLAVALRSVGLEASAE
jgi:ketosteroid isomerase-like protein